MTDMSTLELAGLVRSALLAADALGLDDAALHLNEALVALTGDGVDPAEMSYQQGSPGR